MKTEYFLIAKNRILDINNKSFLIKIDIKSINELNEKKIYDAFKIYYFEEYMKDKKNKLTKDDKQHIYDDMKQIQNYAIIERTTLDFGNLNIIKNKILEIEQKTWYED